MPLREFRCRDCDDRFEEIVTGDASPECPACGSRELDRLLSSFAVASGAPRREAAGGCGACGDPRGPGACALDD